MGQEDDGVMEKRTESKKGSELVILTPVLCVVSLKCNTGLETAGLWGRKCVFDTKLCKLVKTEKESTELYPAGLVNLAS